MIWNVRPKKCLQDAFLEFFFDDGALAEVDEIVDIGRGSGGGLPFTFDKIAGGKAVKAY